MLDFYSIKNIKPYIYQFNFSLPPPPSSPFRKLLILKVSNLRRWWWQILNWPNKLKKYFNSIYCFLCSSGQIFHSLSITPVSLDHQFWYCTTGQCQHQWNMIIVVTEIDLLNVDRAKEQCGMCYSYWGGQKKRS